MISEKNHRSLKHKTVKASSFTLSFCILSWQASLFQQNICILKLPFFLISLLTHWLWDCKIKIRILEIYKLNYFEFTWNGQSSETQVFFSNCGCFHFSKSSAVFLCFLSPVVPAL